jgi:hypothetical protein
MYSNPFDPARLQPSPAVLLAPAAPAPLTARVYQWMALGLGVSGATAAALSRRESLLWGILMSPLKWVLLLAVIALSVTLPGFVLRLRAPFALALLVAYAALMGAALTPVFFFYTSDSLAAAFFVAGGMFAAMSSYGRWTRRELWSWRAFLAMAGVGLVLGTAANLVAAARGGAASGRLYWVATYGCTGGLRRKAAEAAGTPLAIQGAALLYLDFVNLFALLLGVLGRRRD